MQTPDVRIDLLNGLFIPSDGQELAERLSTETGLRVEGDIFDYYSEGTPFPPEIVLAILYTLFPLKDIYANILSSVLLDAGKAAHARLGRPSTQATFFVRRVDEDGQTIKEVRGLSTDPEIVKDLIRRVDEEGEDDDFHYFP